MKIHEDYLWHCENFYLLRMHVSILQAVMKLLINEEGGRKPGVLVPIPQYPLYSASIAEFNMGLVTIQYCDAS